MIREEGSRLILSGPMTLATASALRAAGRPLVAGASRELDLSGVTAVDSAGVAVLLDWVRQARTGGHALSILQAPDALRSLASLYDVAGLLPFSA